MIPRHPLACSVAQATRSISYLPANCIDTYSTRVGTCGETDKSPNVISRFERLKTVSNLDSVHQDHALRRADDVMLWRQQLKPCWPKSAVRLDRIWLAWVPNMNRRHQWFDWLPFGCICLRSSRNASHSDWCLSPRYQILWAMLLTLLISPEKTAVYSYRTILVRSFDLLF